MMVIDNSNPWRYTSLTILHEKNVFVLLAATAKMLEKVGCIGEDDGDGKRDVHGDYWC